MPIKFKNHEPAAEKSGKPDQPEQPGPAATLDERTRHLCKILETQMLTGKLRLSFADYLRLIQWREAKGYDRPHKTVVTWIDPWWLGLIGEMEDHPQINAILEEFKAKGLDKRKKPKNDA
jgi:hypothetical protein